MSKPRAWSPALESGQVISSEVELVVLPVSVTNRHGHSVSGLPKEDFRVYEDGRPQEISLFGRSDVPVTVGLVLDNSRSMWTDRPEVTEAATDFLNSSNADDQVFVVNFSDDATLGMPAGVPFTSNIGTLRESLFRGMEPGRTALYDGVKLGLEHLAGGTTDKKALVIISDGGDNASRATFAQILGLARHGNAIIYAIGILGESSSDVNPKLLTRLTKATGGQAFFPRTAKEVPKICDEIAQELRQQYTLGYTPTNRAQNGSFRTVRVTVDAPNLSGLTVRTRTGYYATAARNSPSAPVATSGSR
ncbi:MAG: VWA domain-containing protein [Candidatus Acidiferrum sp.]